MGQPVVHFEIIARDAEKLQGYYAISPTLRATSSGCSKPACGVEHPSDVLVDARPVCCRLGPYARVQAIAGPRVISVRASEYRGLLGGQRVDPADLFESGEVCVSRADAQAVLDGQRSQVRVRDEVAGQLISGD